MKKAVAITGPSGAGKTTLIKSISHALQGSQVVAIIKNDPSDKASFDKKGKDSQVFYATGANVAVVSPTRTTLFKHETSTIEQASMLLGEYDLLLVEGLKHVDLPRIGIFRGEIESDYLAFVNAIAIDDSIDMSKISLPKEVEILDLNNIEEILTWINNNSKVMEES